jgi:hypothetical protein
LLATYASVIAICAASLAIGQAALALCGWRSWSWLAPATGLALVTALCWGTVRLPGNGALSAAAAALLTGGSLAYLWRRVDGVPAAAREGAPVALCVLVAASLPFIVEGRFGILGTSFNPDMSQHLLAADRLAHDSGPQLLAQGYPLGPHAIVVALHKGIGVSLVHGFDGLTLAVAALASLTALAALGDLRPGVRWLAALLVGLPYMVASYLAQGAFKETMQALFVLAFALGLWVLSPRGVDVWRRGTAGRGEVGPAAGRAPSPSSDTGSSAAGRASSPPQNAQLAAVPLAILAAGSAFGYSFPGLIWPAGTLVIWAVAELYLVEHHGGDFREALRSAVGPASLALIVFAVLVAPEVGRMLDFRHFETFDPNGPGLGNLFGQTSPAEAFGIWPSGDFRLSAGAGAVPAVGFYAGVALAAALLGWGLLWWLRRRELALPAALGAAALVYAAARLTGTPYTASKAIQVGAPLASLVIVRPLLGFQPQDLQPSSLAGVARPLLAAAFVVAAGGCSVLALANGPVGPTYYSPALASFRSQLDRAPTLVLAPESLLADQHGRPYVTWELRGGRICVSQARPPRNAPPPRGVRFVISWRDGAGNAPFSGLQAVRRSGPYVLWRRSGASDGTSSCPLIAVRSARQGERQAG